MSDHDEYVARGFCEETYEGRWCRLPAEHDELGDADYARHVAPWEYEFPKQETMVRWRGTGDDVSDVEWLKWVPATDATARSLP